MCIFVHLTKLFGVGLRVAANGSGWQHICGTKANSGKGAFCVRGKTDSRLCIFVRFLHSLCAGSTGRAAVLRIEANAQGLEMRVGSPW